VSGKHTDLSLQDEIVAAVANLETTRVADLTHLLATADATRVRNV
jgi:hypothetical protein